MIAAPRPTRDSRGLLVRVTGVVQGVGFRPFVHRLAMRHGLAGWVRNESGKVEIAVNGDERELHAFVDALTAEAPTLARVERVDTTSWSPPLGVTGEAAPSEFRLLESRVDPDRRQPVPADVAMCDACAREMLDPANRRFHYPFITCTDCGPRYTVIESLPYDRERTTMRSFIQCPECAQEYRTPGDRRYHSETNSCPLCGPRLWVRLPGASAGVPDRPDRPDDEHPIAIGAALLRNGGIVALRGVGGFHLAADATNHEAVQRLRRRKHRESKPFAIMVATLDDARAVAVVGPQEAEALAERSRPVVLLRRHPNTHIASSVAPGLDTIGVMLAYTPLHLLLLMQVRRPLVMTSGNASEEPIVANNADALERLGQIADLFLLHDREIESPVDDSVLRVSGHRRTFIRRARGYAPLPLAMPSTTPAHILAVGAHLKSTFTLVADGHAFVSPHLGDLDSIETLTHFRATLDRYQRLFHVAPTVIARDLHAGYLSTQIADEIGGDACVAVQHHHAHIAAVLGEHRHRGSVIGVAYDGTGAGDDGTIWGAELLLADSASYARVAHLRPAPLPGGDAAVRAPWRSALGDLSLEPALATSFEFAFDGVEPRERRVVEQQLRSGLNSPLASSMGRLFDAAAAILGVCRHARYEGEAAMLLEALADGHRAHPLPFPVLETAERPQLDPLPLLEAIGSLRARGYDIGELAAAFHESIASSTSEIVRRLCADAGLDTVVLGGGVFQNTRLTESIRSRLTATGLTVLTAIDLPPNDGGVSFGQAVVAAARLVSQ
jgi:hydrogenase maturation protein HypF